MTDTDDGPVDDGQTWLVYDDDCGFCSWWAALAAEHTDLGIAGFGALTDAERERLPDDYEQCVHVLTPDGVLSCGEATEAVLDRLGVLPEGLRQALNRTTAYGPFREKLYRFGADRRALWGKVVSADPPERREPR